MMHLHYGIAAAVCHNIEHNFLQGLVNTTLVPFRTLMEPDAHLLDALGSWLLPLH